MEFKHYGTVSHGTMRPQDLIPAFLDCLREVDPDAYAQMLCCPYGPIPAWVTEEGDSCEWWESGDAMGVLEALFDALNNAAPEGYYFGAHAGDGSDYGFWEIANE